MFGGCLHRRRLLSYTWRGHSPNWPPAARLFWRLTGYGGDTTQWRNMTAAGHAVGEAAALHQWPPLRNRHCLPYYNLYVRIYTRSISSDCSLCSPFPEKDSVSWPCSMPSLSHESCEWIWLSHRLPNRTKIGHADRSNVPSSPREYDKDNLDSHENISISQLNEAREKEARVLSLFDCQCRRSHWKLRMYIFPMIIE